MRSSCRADGTLAGQRSRAAIKQTDRKNEYCTQREKGRQRRDRTGRKRRNKEQEEQTQASGTEPHSWCFHFANYFSLHYYDTTLFSHLAVDGCGVVVSVSDSEGVAASASFM